MGKKEKKINVQLSDEELIPTTIGFLEETKKSSVMLIVFFSIFIIFALFLPNITELFNKLMGKDTNIQVMPSTNKDDENKDETETIKMYDFKEDTSFEYNKIKFSKFTTYQDNNEYYIAFNLENMSDSVINFGEEKYYIETFSSDNALINRHIFKTGKLNVKSNINEVININNNEFTSISKIQISKKDLKDYPDVEIVANSDNNYIFRCSASNSIITYTFDKNKNLININDTVRFNNDSTPNYANNLNKYQNQAVNYNNITGVKSNIVELSSGFTITTDISVNSADFTKLNNEAYYPAKTDIKAINFEMESRDYDCN